MRKFFLKHKNAANFFMLVIFTLFFIISLNAAPNFGKFASRIALLSTKIKLSKEEDIISCFKNFHSDFNNAGGEIENSNKKNGSKSVAKQKNENKEQKKASEEKKGEIIRKQYKPLNNTKTINLQGTAFVQNMTSLPNSVVLKANLEKPAFKIEKTNEPQVLIYHTHTTECYEKTEKKTFDASEPTRSRDAKFNVVGVGEEIVRQLELKGIKAVHVKTIYDDPAYSGAYDRTNAMIVKTLKKHPKIKVLLDVHRDSITNDKKQRIAPVVEINNKKTAQIMIISGCDNGINHYKNYKKNLSFACALEKQLEKDYKNITRPVSFKYKHYNQSLSPGALLVEVGSQANSKDEAHNAGVCFGKALSKLLLSLKT